MGREALLAVQGWLLISGTLAVNSFVFKDQQGAESASRLYQQVNGAVYASATPYGAYSFPIPTFNVQKAAASRIIPVKENFNLQNANGYLKDSYGNRFVEALQSMKSLPFKPFPQQYVQLQELPAHFAQPLSAVPPPSYQQAYKQVPQVVVGSQYRLPQQSPAPTPLNQQFSFAHPGVYANTFKNLTPASFSYGPQFGSVIHVPVRTTALSQDSYKYTPSTQDSSHTVFDNQEQRSAEQQLSSHKAVYANPSPQEQYHHLKSEHKFQRLQEAPQETSFEEGPSDPVPPRQVRHKVTTKQIVSAIKETPIPTVVNGKKTIVNVKTKPPLPLLDINLLEPLTFANPLVPQVQHFLPRINEATYHRLPELDKHEDKKYQKEFVVQKTKTYDSGVNKGKSKKSKKKPKSPQIEHTYDEEYIPAATARPTVTIKGLDEAPEIIYEINSPNYKETYKEQVVNYNKETNSEPVNYNYGTNTHKEPVHYSYTHSSKEPVHIQEVRYEGKGEGPKHLIYNFKPDERDRENKKPKTESNDSGESSEHSEDDGVHRLNNRKHKDHQSTHQETPQSAHNNAPEHREKKYHHKPSSDSHHNVHHKEYNHHHKPNSEAHQNVQQREQEYHHNPNSDAHHQNVQREQEYQHKVNTDAHHNVQHKQHFSKHPQEQFHSIDVNPFQYEEDISLTAPIKVDPQHAQHGNSQANSHYYKNKPKPYHETPSTRVLEKTKQIYIKEEKPEENDHVEEQLTKSMFGNEDDKEQDFENAYKNAAFGFPAYDKSGTDVEKDIYNPESYGVSHDHNTYNIDHSPFQQYQEQGDEFPKEMRLSYKDDREKMKEDYFLDYSVSRPESLVDRYKNKVNYYKLLKDQKPEKYVAHEDNNKQKQSAKLTAIPYSYYPVQGDMKQFFAQYKMAPYASAPFFEYDYSKGAPAAQTDSAAHASRPYYKMNTHFVEPQFQYGFEPISIPRLLDSELAAMATNNNPKSEKPGTRKKIYKENYYIKKTTMSDAPNS